MGTGEQIAERILEFEQAGVNLLLLQFSPQYEEMERFAEEVIPRVRSSTCLSLETRRSRVAVGRPPG